ncbi:peptide chain release factor N(5)-glutamine methyltransferase [Mucilaginibacter pedocola]|uniref:Release factor glutamine methyltransferase n=1 Tax=Mucilaginibacter pedocola TaxID=1792845 RepID=A0A1S9PNL2_9SPHI|nr:peptide chain release factor N(5)-glutamine methyltransferase [Mucilaginibacter pedocola]OOQ62158.1 protein-(glutamine-N5) methyltransferase, release factor-specific [Mucilaginibacter pedocola]
MKTIKEVFLNFHNALDGLYGPQEAEAITLMVLSEISELSRAKIKAFPDDDVPAEALENLPAILTELKTGKPVQYILGSIEFYGLAFLVNPSTLIPRPETEELVEWVLSSQKSKVESQKNVSILDIGTGSGCIAISLKKNLPAATVTAVDISVDALKTAKQNAVINETNVEFVEMDILHPNHSLLTPHYSLIISNPPYVTLHDKIQMHTNVTDFEPHSALFVPEDEPLLFYKAITDFAVTHLSPGGMLFFEINEAFGQETVELLADKGFKDTELRKDMSGRDRMVKGVK